jgi:hypothetical protein
MTTAHRIVSGMTAIVFAAAGGLGGAASGGTSQSSKGQESYDQAFGGCMSGRGYTTK